MKIENLSFIAEVTEEDTSNINGGYSDFDYIDSGYYISDLGIYNSYLENLNGILSIGANSPVIEPTNFGV